MPKEELFRIKEIRDIRDEMDRAEGARKEQLFEAMVEAADSAYKVHPDKIELFVHEHLLIDGGAQYPSLFAECHGDPARATVHVMSIIRLCAADGIEVSVQEACQFVEAATAQYQSR